MPDIRRFDIYRKIPKDLTEPTRTGALISISSIAFILYLLYAEFISYLTPVTVTSIVVDDPTKAAEMIPVQLKITMHNISCQYLGVDIMDDIGRHEVDHNHKTHRQSVNDEKGCYMSFQFSINKVSGNFHVSTHGSSKQPAVTDFSHTVHELIIGDDPPQNTGFQGMPESSLTSFTPLNGRTFISNAPTEVFDHYLKVVPSVYVTDSGKKIYPYQYTPRTRNYNTLSVDIGPAVWFRYDLLPITVQYTPRRVPFYHFLTYMCGVVGGTFTVAGIIDSMLFSATQLYKKAEIGKLT